MIGYDGDSSNSFPGFLRQDVHRRLSRKLHWPQLHLDRWLLLAPPPGMPGAAEYIGFVGDGARDPGDV